MGQLGALAAEVAKKKKAESTAPTDGLKAAAPEATDQPPKKYTLGAATSPEALAAAKVEQHRLARLKHKQAQGK